MKKLSREIYDKIKSKIPNEEVPNLIHSMLFKQAAEIYRQTQEKSLSSPIIAQISLFNLFFRQYNTILVLSRKVAHIGRPDTRYLDITSVHVLIRCCHERFLALWYLASSRVFPNFPSEKEAEFKWLCYQHGGLMDSFKNMEHRSRLVDTSNLAGSINSDQKLYNEIIAKIKSNAIFEQLDNDAKTRIEKYGAWQVVDKRVLSLSALARISPLNSAIVQYEYHTMSLYAHPGYAGLIADKLHDGDVDGLLSYSYTLASFYIKIMDEIFPESSENFTNRELACQREFLEIGENWMQLLPLASWDVQ